MKNIQIFVSEDMYNKLMEISHELVNQSHRHTAMPYIFQVRTIEKVPAADGCGTKAWFNDGDGIETEDEIKEAVFDWNEWDLENEEHESQYSEMSESEIEEVLEEAGFREFWYEEKEVFKNAFLTEKACKEHIESNSHHYSRPVDYLTHAFRNPEIETIQEFLCGLQNKGLHK